MGMFQAILLAASLGWNVVKAAPQDFYISSNVTSASTLSVSTSSKSVFAPSPITGHSQTSLEGPLVSSSTTSGYPVASPVTGVTQSSLDAPSSSSSSSGPNYSPITLYSQSSLAVPAPSIAKSGTALVTPSPHTEHSQTGSSAPISSDTYIDTISRKPDSKPTELPDQKSSASAGHGPISTAGSEPNPSQNPGGVIASIAHQYATSIQSAGVSLTTVPGTASAISVYLVDGTTLTPGASAATIHGTTYSIAPSGGVIYVDGQSSSISVATSRSIGIASAIMSGLNHGGSSVGSPVPTRTSLILTTASQQSSSSSSSSPSPGLQSASLAAQSVLPGLGLTLLCALLPFV